MTLSLKLWGVRGSTPTPGPSTLRYGGETTCFEIHAGDDIFMIDCGSGARSLGMELHARPPAEYDLFFTHTHLDHICGLPFFTPAYDDRFSINAWAGHFADSSGLMDIICRIMSPPIFPVAANTLRAVTFRNFRAGGEVERKGAASLTTIALNHPGGATGYRITHEGKSICVITDHEHGDAEVDRAVRRFVEGADVMIYDAMYTDDEYARFAGWGHSTWQKGVELGLEAGISQVVLHHHDPKRSDDALDAIGEEAARRHPGAVIGREGMVVVP